MTPDLVGDFLLTGRYLVCSIEGSEGGIFLIQVVVSGFTDSALVPFVLELVLFVFSTLPTHIVVLANPSLVLQAFNVLPPSGE